MKKKYRRFPEDSKVTENGKFTYEEELYFIWGLTEEDCLFVGYSFLEAIKKYEEIYGEDA